MLKPLHKVSPILQRMLLKLQKYDLELHYMKGKELHLADALNTNQREPLLPHSVPAHPLEKVGVEFFSLDGKDFLLIVPSTQR